MAEIDKRPIKGIPELNVYIIAHDEYMGISNDITSFVGTWRELLYDVNGIDPDNVNEPLDEEHPEGRKIGDLTDEELVNLFNEANGDGQPYYVVFDVKADKKVLG